MELLLEDGGRGLLDKLRVELQYYQKSGDVFLRVLVHDRFVATHA